MITDSVIDYGIFFCNTSTFLAFILDIQPYNLQLKDFSCVFYYLDLYFIVLYYSIIYNIKNNIKKQLW